MNARRLGQVLFVLLGVAAQAMVGWWALGGVAFVAGVVFRRRPWVAVRYATGIAGAGALMLAWLAWIGNPIGEVRSVLGELTGIPALALALLLPALVAFGAAYLGAAAGRRVLFG